MALGRNVMSICNGLKIEYRNESRYVGVLSCCRHQPCALCCGDDPLLLTMTECSDTYQAEAHKLTSASQPPQLSHPLLLFYRGKFCMAHPANMVFLALVRLIGSQNNGPDHDTIIKDS